MEFLSAIFAITVVVGLASVSAYPEGPPLSCCSHMFPVGHEVNAQTSTPTVTIKMKNSGGSDTTSYTAGEQITVTVETANPSDTTIYYEGLFVQARRANCMSHQKMQPVGTFSFEANNTYLKTLDCGSVSKSAVSQKVSVHQTSQTFTWTAPATTVGHVYFQATVVKNVSRFWTGVQSGFLYDAADTGNATYCMVRKTTGGVGTIQAHGVLPLLGFIVFVANVIGV
ncbi:putative defense protein Hdd11 [Gigantopelta aegis]|uniref:putative defense protein Hdd11 n=1 Tax=Gigantopelta aegis TaxID=1735272 RepID=UPI001B88C790|nr:putative defense protein Hdd11 [Gigantopelta aegis]